MKKIFTLLLSGSLFAALFTACSTDDAIAESDLTLEANMQTAEVTVADLVGTWNMYSMTSVATEDGQAVPVDFDQDGTYTYDLLEETDCFDSMYFIFDEQGNVDTNQSRLYFSSTTGMFSCQTTGDYNAAYTISGNELSVTFTINGNKYTETKTISRNNDDAGNEFLTVTLTKSETNTAVYVAEDPGNTVASELQKIEMVYIKTQ